MTVTWSFLIAGPLIGFSVGVLTGFFGAGGGFIITPVLNICLGLEMNIAVGTSACQVLGASSFSLLHHRDRRLMGIKVALCTGAGIPLGAFAGARLVKVLKGLAPWQLNGVTIDPVNMLLLSVFAVFLLLVGAWMAFDNFVRCRHRPDDDQRHVGILASWHVPPMIRFRTVPGGPVSLPLLVLMGVLMGFLSGLLGIGGGVIMLPALFYLVGQETKYATRSDMMLVFVSGLFSTAFHALDRNIHYPLALALMAGAFFGTRVGASLQQRVQGKSIRQYFCFVVLAAWALVMVKLLATLFPRM